MRKHVIPQGVEIDHCAAHGVWLDLGELESLLARAPSSQGAPSGLGSAVQDAGRHFGQSVVMGAGATVGNRIVGGIIDAVFGRR